MAILNLGQVSSIKVGSTPPSNTNLLWYDTTTSGNSSKVKYYNESVASWLPLTGDNGWMPSMRSVTSSGSEYIQIYDWFGGTGTKPTQTGFLSPSGLTNDINQATNYKGDDGDSGWTYIISNVNHNGGVIQQIVDWFGGTGTKPPVGVYIGQGGYVIDPNDATNIKGEDGGGVGTGDKNYIYAQTTPSSTWIIDHDLNKKCSVTVIDTAGTVVAGNVTINNGSRVEVKFNSPFSGEVILN